MDATLGALAEPNRLRIVELLRAGPCSVNEIVERLQLSQPLISKHLRVLKKARLVGARPNAQQRIYELEEIPFKELSAWLDTFADVWRDRLDTLDDYLQTMKEEGSEHDEQE